MKNWKKCIITGLVVVWILFSVFVVVPALPKSPDIYAGTLVFNTEQEYTTFKTYLKDSIETGTTLRSLSVLASEPPIIVKFSVAVPHDEPFGYGKGSDKAMDSLIVSFTIIMLGVVVVLIPFSFLSDSDQ